MGNVGKILYDRVGDFVKNAAEYRLEKTMLDKPNEQAHPIDGFL